MAEHCALSRDRNFWGQSLAVLMPLTISLRCSAIIGRALLKSAACCWGDRTWGNTDPCVIMVTIFAGMSIISTKSERSLPGQGPGTSASWMGWSRRMKSERWMAKRITMTKERTKIAARHIYSLSPVNGVSSFALISFGGGSLLLEVWGKAFCVSCLDFSYTCLHKNFV